MKKINNYGFTLVELIVTIVLLVLVMSIGAYSITGIVKNSKEKDYELLVREIKNASEDYYLECKYGDVDDLITGCDNLSDGVSLGNLVMFGYLTGNGKDNDDKNTLVNPNDGNSITECIIKIIYDNDSGKVNVIADNPTGSCPTNEDYNG